MADVLNSSEDNATLDDENLETTDEPTRAELKEMLVDIHADKHTKYPARKQRNEKGDC